MLFHKFSKIVSCLILALVMVLILSGCATDEKAWQEAANQNTIESYDAYLEKYPEGEYALEAKEKSEALLWQKVSRINSIPACEDYLEKYPDGKFIDVAIEKLDELRWLRATTEDTIGSYKQYLADSPHGEYTTNAEIRIDDLIWMEDAIADLTIIDKAFEARYKEDQDVKVTIVKIEDTNIHFIPERIYFSMGNEISIWYNSAIHTWMGVLNYRGYTFNSDQDNPLQFKVVADKGYDFLGGKGTVARPYRKVGKLYR